MNPRVLRQEFIVHQAKMAAAQEWVAQLRQWAKQGYTTQEDLPMENTVLFLPADPSAASAPAAAQPPTIVTAPTADPPVQPVAIAAPPASNTMVVATPAVHTSTIERSSCSSAEDTSLSSLESAGLVACMEVAAAIPALSFPVVDKTPARDEWPEDLFMGLGPEGTSSTTTELVTTQPLVLNTLDAPIMRTTPDSATINITTAQRLVASTVSSGPDPVIAEERPQLLDVPAPPQTVVCNGVSVPQPDSRHDPGEVERLCQEVSQLRAELRAQGQATRAAIQDTNDRGRDYPFQVATNLKAILEAVLQPPQPQPSDPALLRAMPHLRRFAEAYLDPPK